MDSAVERHLRHLIFQRLADIVAENGVVMSAILSILA
jgi:putative restriction endonuclease